MKLKCLDRRSPQEMSQLVDAILTTYDNRKVAASQMQTETNAMMNPEVIGRMRLLQAELQKHFL